MVRCASPTYSFVFRGGVSSMGVVDRTSPEVDGGRLYQLRYRLDDFPLARRLGHRMPAAVADLVDVAAAIYVSDRLAPREPRGDTRPTHDRWHRRLHVAVPVRNPDRWRAPAVVTCLTDLLYFLTDDAWTFTFTDRIHAPRQSQAQASFLWQPSRPEAVVLHSGGLDSLMGQIELLSGAEGAMVAPVTVVTSSRMNRAAHAVIGALGEVEPPASSLLQPARLDIRIERGGRPRDDRERSHRSRAILFLAAGIGAAVMANTDRLHVCENGVGAISLPMTSDHWGARASKAMHPRTLALFSTLASLVLDRSMGIQNLGLFTTKGELVRKLQGERFASAARQTVSCDRASYMRRGEACGRCTSCILRRVALIAEDLDSLVDAQAITYEIDWLKPGAQWDRQSAVHIVAMRHQVERLRVALAADPGGFAPLAAVFPELLDVVAEAPSLGLTEPEVERRLHRLYRAYVREFDAFVASIDRPRWGRQASVTDVSPAAVVAAAS